MSLLLAAVLLGGGAGTSAGPTGGPAWQEECPARNRSFRMDRCVMRLRTVDAELAVWVDSKSAWISLTSLARDPASREPCHLETSKPVPKNAAALPPRVLIRDLNQTVTMMEAGRECHVVELPQFRDSDRDRLLLFLERAAARVTVSPEQRKR